MFVFVHGLYGWGEQDPLWPALPYWGLASGDLIKYLRAKGCSCVAASVSPAGSAWDRACELYACLTGTVTDYGAAHAARFGHPRFGRQYTAPLLPAWSADTPVELIGHSFGGATIRLLAHLLAFGAPEEVSACAEPSPLFLGGQAGLVRSVTCIASPHNGTTLLEAEPALPALVSRLAEDISALLPSPALAEALRERSGAATIKEDTALYDLTLPGAAAVNRFIRDVPTVVYRSVPCCRTHGGLTAAQVPDITMPTLLKPCAARIGKHYHVNSATGEYLTPEWAANDGLVNTLSARAPAGAVCKRAPVPGCWYVLPRRTDDHFEIIGGFHPTDILRVRRFYLGLLNSIQSGNIKQKEYSHGQT